MPIGLLTKLEVSLNMVYLAQQVAMVFQYEVDLMPDPGTAAEWGEGWWNFVKTTTRGLCQSDQTGVFRNVKVRELSLASGAYGTYDIPLAEQAGTRSTGSGGQMPPYVAAGVQLVVGTRVTRPGQKRMPFVTEGDNTAGVMSAALQTSMIAWCNVITAPMTLGAPVSGNRLLPVVVSKDAGGNVTAFQYITGYLINTNLTSQNSRKIGRGI